MENVLIYKEVCSFFFLSVYIITNINITSIININISFGNKLSKFKK